MSEEELRIQVLIPVLRATPDVTNVTDVHGQNERGLDVIFFTDNDIERICYGLQLKKGNISGGGTGDRTVKQIVDQLELANDFEHPVATRNAGEFKVDRFIVATSGTISATARTEIASRLKSIPVKFWDGHELIRRIHKYVPEMFQVSDAASARYLTKIVGQFDALDALDQIPGVAKRTLSQVFEEPRLRRIFDPALSSGEFGSPREATLPALTLLTEQHNAVVVADQDGGKTAILRMIALQQAKGVLSGTLSNTPLPVLIRAKELLTSGFSVTDAISAAFRRLGEVDLAVSAQEDIEAGHYFVEVDGFSELLCDQDKERAAQLIESFAELHPEIRVIVAARPVDFLTHRYFAAFRHYRIEDFDERQSASLVRRWTGNSSRYADVANKMAARLREALQLPGSPIPATIGVMLHEEQGRYITNTAEAIDRYMVIRLGRYANELGLKQEVDWARKEDLLSEVAYAMVDASRDTISEADFIDQIEGIQRRQGDTPRGRVILEELVGSGVLARDGANLSFFRTSFRDFFAAKHVHQRGDLDQFAIANLFDRRWGGVSVFAAGLRRSNSALLNGMAATVGRLKANAIDGRLGDDYFYGAFVCGRLLANSESADNAPKVAALRTAVEAVNDSVPELADLATKQYGNIGQLMAVVAAEHAFFVAVGVPWLRKQFEELLADLTLTDEERFFLASTYTNLGYEDCYSVLERAIKGSTSTRVLVALQVMLWQLDQTRTVDGEERVALEALRRLVKKKLAGRKAEVQSLWEMKAPALKLEQDRIRRLHNKAKRESGN